MVLLVLMDTEFESCIFKCALFMDSNLRPSHVKKPEGGGWGDDRDSGLYGLDGIHQESSAFQGSDNAYIDHDLLRG